MTIKQKTLRFHRAGARNDSTNDTNTHHIPGKLDRLAPELLDLLCSYLSSPDLCHLVQTNRRLRHHVECMLFTHLQLPCTITQSGLCRLIKKLKKQPMLSRGVQSFRFEFGIIQINGKREKYPPGQWRHQYEKWKMRLKLVRQPTSLPEIFTLVPNIRRLRVHASLLEGSPFQEFSRQKPCSLCRSKRSGSSECKLAFPFHQLEVLEVDQEWLNFECVYRSKVVEALGKFVSLPSLREYSGPVLICSNEWPGPYSLEKLSIMAADDGTYGGRNTFKIEKARLSELLSRCDRLRRIGFTHHARKERGFPWGDLHELLLKVKDRLRELVIVDQQHFPMPYFDYDYGFRNMTLFGSLVQFEQLESLEMPWMLLTEKNMVIKGAVPRGRMGNILPRSLRRLVINDYVGFLGRIDWYKREHGHRGRDAWLMTCANGQNEVFIEYVMHWRVYTPRLEGVKVRWDQGQYGTVGESQTKFVREICRTRDFNLEFAS